MILKASPNTRKLFLFLKKNGALIQFCRNIRWQNNSTVLTALNKCCAGSRIDHSIDNAFIWDKTPEGEDFWSHLYDIST